MMMLLQMMLTMMRPQISSEWWMIKPYPRMKSIRTVFPTVFRVFGFSRQFRRNCNKNLKLTELLVRAALICLLFYLRPSILPPFVISGYSLPHYYRIHWKNSFNCHASKLKLLTINLTLAKDSGHSIQFSIEKCEIFWPKWVKFDHYPLSTREHAAGWQLEIALRQGHKLLSSLQDADYSRYSRLQLQWQTVCVPPKSRLRSKETSLNYIIQPHRNVFLL